MCRIAGIMDVSIPVEAIEEMVKKMGDIQEHGGPDDEGMFTSRHDHLVLGNRRLALLDISDAGHQPMQWQNRYWITYNGELYNFHALRNELISMGHQFRSHSDTEVILAAFSQWQHQAFARLKGMFAFALLDSHTRELFLVRDPAGMKPLYFSYSPGKICFASEIRAISSIPSMNTENTNWPIYLMAYGHIPEPVTTLAGVHPLRKGCFFKYNLASGEHSLQSFKHYSYIVSRREPSEIIPELKSMVEDSVERHLVADATVGIFLSGGLDSSIIASVAAKNQKSSINTLSIYFEEAEFSEKKYQDILIDKIRSRSSQFLLKENEFHECLPDFLEEMDIPCSDGINTWFISKYAKAQGLKAVLTGLGADELFGGYPSFSRMRFTHLVQKTMPGFAKQTRKKSKIKQLNRLSYLGMEGVRGLYLFLRGHFSPYEIARQLDADESEIWSRLDSLPVINKINGLNNKNLASWMEFNLYMQNQLLRDADVMGMAHGIEIRVPFLDNDLVCFANSVDPSIKFKGTQGKQILIDSFKDVLPDSIWNRPKMGFSFPFSKWLKSSEFVRDIMKEGGEASQVNFKKFLDGGLHWSHLMSLIILRKKNLV
jgi:asparagine synthase (glutamine-hydrolysing)